MDFPTVPFWKKIPFLRVLLPLIAGIIAQWNFSFPLTVIYTTATASLVLFLILQFLPLFVIFRYSWLTGIAINFVFVSLGGFLVHQKDIRNDADWIGRYYQDGNAVVVTLQESLVEKENSFKAIATVRELGNDTWLIPVKGKVILYFKKDSSAGHLVYGSQLVFKKPLQEIKNTGSPGGFDYKRYCLFLGITHQAYLKENEFVVLQGKYSFGANVLE